MEFEYVATNNIPIISPLSDVKRYMELCCWYFIGHITKPTLTPVTQDIVDTLREGQKSTYLVWNGDASPEGLDVVNYGHLGFATQILYDKPMFKLRLFADKKLRERGFESTFEPMRKHLTSGPKQIGLDVERVVEDKSEVEVPDPSFSFEDLEQHQRDVLNNWYEDYLKRSQWELGDPDKFEGGSLEYSYQQDEICSAEKKADLFKIKIDNMDKISFKENLRKNKSLFKELRDKFVQRFHERMEDLESTALGILPWYHRRTMIDSFGSLILEPAFLPVFISGGFDDCRDNFMEAEVIVPPKSGYCKYFISMFPYTSSIQEFNQTQERFFDDDEIIEAMIGHELAEVTEGIAPVTVSLSDYLSDSREMYRIQQKMKEERQSRHKIIDNIMLDMGLGEPTKKMLRLYKETAERLLPQYNFSFDPDFEFYDTVGDRIKESIKLLDESLSRLG